MNVKKTEMIFHPKSIGDDTAVYIHNVPITQVSSYKYIVFILIALLHGMFMLTVCVLGYNKGCIF